MSGEEQSLDSLLKDIFDGVKKTAPTSPGATKDEPSAESEEVHYHQGLESVQDMNETEEAMVQAYQGIDKKKPGVWQIFKMKNKRVVDHQRGIDRGLAKMGGKIRWPIMQLAVLGAVTVVASTALSNKPLVAYVATSLAVRNTQLEVLGFVGALAVIIVLLARSGRLGSKGGRKN